MKLYHWKKQFVQFLFNGGNQGTTADTSRKTVDHRRNRIWDPYACGTYSHSWKPCSSTAFLTLALYLGFRRFCSTHMDNGNFAWLREDAGQHSGEHQTNTYSSLQDKGSWEQPHSRPARTIKLRTVTSEHGLHLHNHHTIMVSHSLQPST